MSLEELLGKPKIHCHLFALSSFAFRCFGLLAHCTRLLTALDASRCTALALLPASLERKRILSNFPRNSQKVGNSKEFCKTFSPLPSSTCFLDWEGKKLKIYEHFLTPEPGPSLFLQRVTWKNWSSGWANLELGALVIDGPLTYLR